MKVINFVDYRIPPPTSTLFSKRSFTYNISMSEISNSKNEIGINDKMKNKFIFHMDGDAFFVAVEIAKNQKLKGLPVVTGEEKGIVSALSYEAKALGVVRGMPIFKLRKEFPNVIVLPGDYRSYVKYSKMMFDIVRRYIDDVEEYSIDECFGDLTGLDKPLKMSYLDIANRIKKEVNEELKLSVSIGIAPTKVLAKVASKWQKPNGLTVIDQNTKFDFLEKTLAEKIWGIGRQTSFFLNRKGIKTAMDFVNKDISWIRENLSKPYEIIWHELRGVSLIELDSNIKTNYSSVQKTRSFHPATNDRAFLLSQLSKHIEDACAKARHYNLSPKSISFFIKTRNFEYFTYKIILETVTNSPEIINSLVNEYFDKVYKKDFLYRTTGVSLLGLMPSSLLQNDLFGNRKKANKFEVIHKQIDILENKYGRKSVYLASTHNAIKRDVTGFDSDDLDRDLLFL